MTQTADTKRFARQDETVRDRITGLEWPLNAQPAVTGLSWPEALDFVRDMNKNATFGHSDWRLPNRRELYTLIDHDQREPAMPSDHPFRSVWKGRYWTSTTSAKAPAYAWWVQFSGGRMFYGNKADDCAVWPVRGTASGLAVTGQDRCFDVTGQTMDCLDSLQDGALRLGIPWPTPRFERSGDQVTDQLTKLVWRSATDLTDGVTDWAGARHAAADHAHETGLPWRLPTILELESLTDCSRSDPALPQGHPFTEVREAYWSATTSGFDREWAFCLYLHKGAVGVGFKPSREFHVWVVRNQTEPA